MNANQSFFPKSLPTALLHIGIASLLSLLLFQQLNGLRHNKVFGSEKVEQIKTVNSDGDSIGTRTVITPLPAARTLGEKPTVDFFDILLLMFISGALGGALCNLRGLFVHFRDEGGFDPDLFIPYLTRPFTGAVCGLFVYFVASLLVTSITLVPTADGIGFQGMISYIAMAIVAGFGSQEFMERLKAVASTLFGEQKDKSPSARLYSYKKLLDRGLITQAQFDTLSNKAVENLPEEEGYERLTGPPPQG